MDRHASPWLGARPRLKMSRGRYLRRQIELRTTPLQLGTLVPKSPHRFQVGDTGQLGSHADSPEKTGINSVDVRGSALAPIVKRILVNAARCRGIPVRHAEAYALGNPSRHRLRELRRSTAGLGWRLTALALCRDAGFWLSLASPLPWPETRL